ncbi:hypothetical protein PISMIDRAFT_685771, partial [Pisolithus microcarpus 441]
GPWHLRDSIAVARHAYILSSRTEADAASIGSSVCHRLECFLPESSPSADWVVANGSRCHTQSRQKTGDIRAWRLYQ